MQCVTYHVTHDDSSGNIRIVRMVQYWIFPIGSLKILKPEFSMTIPQTHMINITMDAGWSSHRMMGKYFKCLIICTICCHAYAYAPLYMYTLEDTKSISLTRLNGAHKFDIKHHESCTAHVYVIKNIH